ncbi:MAG: DUF2239 family protein [Azospirillaceae bacterium]
MNGSRLAAGALGDVASAVKRVLDAEQTAGILVFDDATGRVVDLDLSGDAVSVAWRYAVVPGAETETSSEAGTQTQRGRGRPRMGVVAREVTLLPRHWDWLAGQPGGASAALRRLVDAARRESGELDRTRAAREAAYRFMSALAGDLPRFEEAARALFAGDRAKLDREMADWPADIRAYALRLLEGGRD